jgi:hypothetical protein
MSSDFIGLFLGGCGVVCMAFQKFTLVELFLGNGELLVNFECFACDHRCVGGCCWLVGCPSFSPVFQPFFDADF